MTPLKVVRVKVIVLEDDQEVGSVNVGYYAGQPYTVKIDTPDGVDAKIDRETGAP